MPAFPPKTNYAAGDVLTAAQMNDVGNALAAYQFNAGKNKIINGDFGIWQRGTSFSYTGSAASIYTADRWDWFADGNGTFTVSQQTFTPGTAPVSGYESQYFLRGAVNTLGTSTQGQINQKIEDVRTFADQTVTVSFWAKASTTTNVNVTRFQNFGSGGSTQVSASIGDVSVTTSWARYSITAAIPSISGKTVGSSSFLRFRFLATLSASLTIDFWGVQVEAGSTATPFTTATGTLAGELAACQRYYYRHVTGTSASVESGWYYSSTVARTYLPFKQTMRIVPTADISSGTNYFTIETGGATVNFTTMTLLRATTNGSTLDFTGVTGGVTGEAGEVFTNNASAYVGFSAEL